LAVNAGSILADVRVQLDQLSGDVKKVNANFDKIASGARTSSQQTQSSLGLIRKAVAGIGVAFVAGKTIEGFRSLIDAASDAEEIGSKFDVTFSSIQSRAQSFADELRNSYNQSSTGAKELLANTGDLLTGFGFTQNAALDLSIEVQRLAVDLASFTNFSGGAEGASQALTKALLGERESVKSLGISILESDVQARVFENSQKGLTFETERQAKAFATLQIAQEQSKNAIGDVARTSDSYANQQRLLNNRIDDFRELLGKEILPVATRTIGLFVDFINGLSNLNPKVTLITGSIGVLSIALIALNAALGPIGLIIAGLGALAVGATIAVGKLTDVQGQIANIGKKTQELREREKALNDEYDRSVESRDKIEKKIERINELLEENKKKQKELAAAERNGIDVDIEKNNALNEQERLTGALQAQNQKLIDANRVVAESEKKVTDTKQRINELTLKSNDLLAKNTDETKKNTAAKNQNASGQAERDSITITKEQIALQDELLEKAAERALTEDELTLRRIELSRAAALSISGDNQELVNSVNSYYDALRDDEAFRQFQDNGEKTFDEQLEYVNETLSQISRAYNAVFGQISGAVSEYFTLITRIQERQTQKEIDNLEAARDKELRIAEGNADAQNQINLKYDALVEKQKKDLNDKLNKEKKKQFYIEKAFRITESLIETQSAALSAFAAGAKIGGPIVGGIFAGIAEAFGLAKTILIAAQPAPAFQDGGIVPGSSFSGDRVVARVNSGEAILTREQQQRLLNIADGSEVVSSGATNITVPVYLGSDKLGEVLLRKTSAGEWLISQRAIV
jgi:hypothetical protein